MHKLFFPFLFISLMYAAAPAHGQTISGGLKKNMEQSSGNPAERYTEYEIGGITVTGASFLDEDLLITVTGLTVGDKVRLPNDEKIGKAIRNLWKQELFTDISIYTSKIVGDKIFLNIRVEERPRLSKYNFKGIK
jgi:outer membrane protein insertion porin family